MENGKNLTIKYIGFMQLFAALNVCIQFKWFTKCMKRANVSSQCENHWNVPSDAIFFARSLSTKYEVTKIRCARFFLWWHFWHIEIYASYVFHLFYTDAFTLALSLSLCVSAIWLLQSGVPKIIWIFCLRFILRMGYLIHVGLETRHFSSVIFIFHRILSK